jgi:RimK family alpha-L-glutamate ligase
MNLAIIAAGRTYENKRILEESKAFFKKTEIILLPKTTVQIMDNQIIFLHNNQDLRNNFNRFLIRGTSRFDLLAILLASYMYQSGKVIIDEKLAKPRGASTKLSTLMQLAKNNIKVPDSFYAFGKDNIFKLIQNFNFPLIIKRKKSSQGRGVYKIDNQKELESFLQNNPKMENFIYQRYINSNFDIRVFVTGNKILGAMKRVAPSGDFRSNIAVGGKGEKFNPTEEITAAAVKSAQIMKNEIAGVDIMIEKDKPFVIEVNRAPQFKAFEKITGINVAKKICEYVCEKGQNG